jgi:CubicO group peptidase (beta-lactamase class C family)
VPGLMTPVSSEEARDDVRMAGLLAAQAPIAPPGAVVTYHVLTYGWLCGELVRRVDGRSVGRFLREEVAEPLGLDVWIGLPEEQEPRVAVLEQTAGFDAEAAAPVVGGPDAAGERERILWSLENPPGSLAVANSRAERAAEVPAANGVATARALARLYGCLARGGELDGVRLLAPETAALAGRCIVRGHDPYHDRPIAYAAGFHLNPDGDLGPPADAFGHGGAGGSTHGCWPGLRTGFSFTTNLLDGPVNPRGPALLAALHDAVTAT